MPSPLPLPEETLKKAAQQFGTPVHVYSKSLIAQRAQAVNRAFANFPAFQNFFAVKATPTPAVLRALFAEGMGADASSMAELVMAEKMGKTGDQVMFTSNGTPPEEFKKALEIGAMINLDDVSLIDSLLAQNGGRAPRTVCFRLNPGAQKSGGNDIIGQPAEAKFGITPEQICAAYTRMRDAGAEVFGLHTMVGSNVLDPEYFADTAQLLVQSAQHLERETGIQISFFNAGGGFGVPYLPGQEPLNLEKVAAGIQRVFEEHYGQEPRNWPRLVMENGRYLTAPTGTLLARVRNVKRTHRTFAVVDACMADLMRPGMYGAYHEISPLLGGEQRETETADIVGNLCENNDKFAIQRELPRLQSGDLLAIHDAGGHGRAMGFNYNGKLRSGEVLVHENGDMELIRRKETLEDYFATLIW